MNSRERKVMKNENGIGGKFEVLVAIMKRLRGKNGCPWDREQDEKSIADFFLEEVYEAVDAIQKGDAESLCEELGDVLMEVVFLARIYEEKKRFDISRVLDGIIDKMIRRHPHVFQGETAGTAREVRKNWDRLKTEEKKRTSLLDGLPHSCPALLEAFQLGRRVSGCGFDWEKPGDVLLKLKEEVDELEKALDNGEKEAAARELGDILFSAANTARHLDMNPELVLKKANKRFMRRFRRLEKIVRKRGKDLSSLSLREMDRIWEEVKKEEK